MRKQSELTKITEDE